MLVLQGKRYKFFNQGCAQGTSGVGIAIAERWIDNVVCVNRISERLMHLKVVVGQQPFNIVTAYAPQVGREERERRMSFGRWLWVRS